MKFVYLRSLLETLAMLGWFEKKHLPMRERALVELWNVQVLHVSALLEAS